MRRVFIALLVAISFPAYGQISVGGDSGACDSGGACGVALTAPAYSASAGSGSNGLSLLTSGARLDLGGGTSDYITSNGSGAQFTTSVTLGSATSLVWGAGGNSISGTDSAALTLNSTAAVAGAVDIRGGNSNAAAVTLRTGTAIGMTVGLVGTVPAVKVANNTAANLPTCNSTIQNYMVIVQDAGGSVRSRLCLCASDNAGSPAFAWVSLAGGTVGTSTACNAP